MGIPHPRPHLPECGTPIRSYSRRSALRRPRAPHRFACALNSRQRRRAGPSRADPSRADGETPPRPPDPERFSGVRAQEPWRGKRLPETRPCAGAPRVKEYTISPPTPTDRRRAREFGCLSLSNRSRSVNRMRPENVTASSDSPRKFLRRAVASRRKLSRL